ncbi:hypothetical protein PO909_023760 [Leuciscus waleckii]
MTQSLAYFDKNGFYGDITYADDTQIYLALSPNDYSPIDSLGQCIDEVNSWMCQNFLQLNKDKTEVIVFGNKDEVLKHSSFPTEKSKVAFVITLLSGRAALWGTTVWEQGHDCLESFQTFSTELKKVFNRAVAGKEAARVLADLRQDHRSVTDYSIEFRTLAAECKWNSEAQWDMFLHGLADRIQNEIYTLELPATLDGLIDLAIRVDASLQRRGLLVQRGRVPAMEVHPVFPSGDAVGPSFDPEPMQVGRARLSREEKERRRAQGLCLYCGAGGHFASKCPVKANTRQ